MLTRDQFRDLSLGETVSCGRLFPGMTSECIQLTKTSMLGDKVLTRATYFGVFVGKYQVWLNSKGKISLLKVA